METLRVRATDKAFELTWQLHQLHEPLMFHQSGGCCDGSQPMCIAEGDFIIGNRDVCLGVIKSREFYMGRDQFEYWKHT